MDGMMTAPQPQDMGIHGVDPAELEKFMAEKVQSEAPDEANEFLEGIQEDGLSAEEVDEVRQVTLAALKSPDAFPQLTAYLVNAELIDEEDIPKEYDGGFVLAILGLVGLAQDLVTSSTPQ